MTLNSRVLIVGFVLLLIDLYFYQAILTVLKDSSTARRDQISFLYWGFTIITFLVFLTPIIYPIHEWPKFLRVYLLGLLVMAIISKLIGSLFIATDDIIRLFRWLGSFIVKSDVNAGQVPEHTISRLTFLNRIAVSMAFIPFTAFVYGMARGAFNYKVHKIKVVLPNLPDEFIGFKILQVSDIHAGSFVSKTPVQEAVGIINQQNADVVFFTGDLVNDRANEMDPLMDVLDKIKAPHGVFSVLGNHDYGDYVRWPNREEKRKNLEDLKNVHKRLGWRLLMNEHVPIKKGTSEIAVLGIENWGANLNFPKYGDLSKAYAGAEKYPVKLLLSHDPSHWNMQVKEEYKDIDITFSGHTHGFQFGIDIPGFKWSPSQYVYKQWAGLYRNGEQYIYVNRGLGFLGYPGRLGILPEITVLELHKA